jgi:hypothetical protein
MSRAEAGATGVRRVPWTCAWGRFGTVNESARADDMFVFWSCAHPDRGQAPILSREECENCPWWTPAVPDARPDDREAA